MRGTADIIPLVFRGKECDDLSCERLMQGEGRCRVSLFQNSKGACRARNLFPAEIGFEAQDRYYSKKFVHWMGASQRLLFCLDGGSLP